MTIFSVFRKLTAPISVVMLIWGFSLSIYLMAFALGDEMFYFQWLVSTENLYDYSTFMSFLWLLIGLLSFSAGALFIRSRHSNPRGTYKEINSDKAVRFLLLAFIFTAFVAFLWIGSAVFTVGGFTRLMVLAASDNVTVRETVLSSAFPGGRLISSGFIGIAVFSSTLLSSSAATRNPLARKPLVIAIFLTSLLFLGFKPILVSGRIDFFGACIGSLVAASYAAKRIVGIKYIVPGLFVLGIVWGAKEFYSMGHVTSQMFDISVARQGAEALLFYFYNDMLNALNSLGRFDGYYTYGWYSMRFAFFFTFTDSVFLESILESRTYIGNWMSSGEIPMLAAPFRDFGVFGIFVLFALGAICQHVCTKSFRQLEYAALYGLVFVALLMSIHNSMITSQEVIYSALLIKLISFVSRKPKSYLWRSSE